MRNYIKTMTTTGNHRSAHFMFFDDEEFLEFRRSYPLDPTRAVLHHVPPGHNPGLFHVVGESYQDYMMRAGIS